MYIYLDVETRSLADLPTVGAWRYAEDPSTDIICIAWAIDTGEVHAWSPLRDPTFPAELAEALRDPESIVVARNVLFERAIYLNIIVPRYLGGRDTLRVDQWECTAALSRMHGLPASLAECAQIINSTHKKLEEGKRLIQLYSRPARDRKTGSVYNRDIPDSDLDLFLHYNTYDVLADREIHQKLCDLTNPRSQQHIVTHDIQLNTRGVRVDVAQLASIRAKLAAMTERAEREAGAYGVNVRSPQQLKGFCADRGVYIADTREDTIAALLDSTSDPDIKHLCALRLFLGKASTKKYDALAMRVSPDGRLRYFLRYHGAHTGRFSGEGVQLHNLPKSGATIEDIYRLRDEFVNITDYAICIQAAKALLPTLLIPDDGNAFIMGDFAAIEARGIAYLAGCASLLNQFSAGEDPYKIMAAKIYRVPITEVTPLQRKLGKITILGAGYGMGAVKFQATCVAWGVTISEALARTAIDTYRRQYAEIPTFWRDCEEAFMRALRSGQVQEHGRLLVVPTADIIRVVLPSGRRLYYHSVQRDPKSGQLSYYNYAKKMPVYIWGGIIAENITQAMCADILTDRMVALEGQGLPVRMHVHDEIVIECGKKGVEADKRLFDAIMATPPSWLPGFPLAAESAVSPFYLK